MKITLESPTQLVLESKVIFGLLGATSYVFNRGDGKLKISGKGLLGRKQEEFPLTEFTGAIVQEQARTGSDRDLSNLAYRVVLLRKEGPFYPLTKVYTSGKKRKEELAQKIGQFLAE